MEQIIAAMKLDGKRKAEADGTARAPAHYVRGEERQRQKAATRRRALSIGVQLSGGDFNRHLNSIGLLLYECELMRVDQVPLASVRRPLQRFLDEDKVEALMASIRLEGLREPIDLLEVDGQLWGFNGCHRVAAHERLGLPTIRARIRQATSRDLNLHLR